MIRLRKIFGAAILMAFAASSVSAQQIVSKAAHSDMHKQLLANQAKSKDQIRLVEILLSTLLMTSNLSLTSIPKVGTAKP